MTSSSTCSRSSAARRSWAPAPTRTSTPTPPAGCCPRWPAWPRTSSPTACRTPTAPAGLRPGRPARCGCPSRSRSRTPPTWTAAGACWTSPASSGGTVIPPSLRWAIAELVLGANPAVHMYSAGMAFAKVLYYAGTEDQKKLAAHMAEKQWGATMVLTEPDAGSDVGAGRTKAVQQPDGTWHITGRQAVHHLRRARPERQHRPLRPGPARGRRPRHQGAVAVHRPQVPRRPRDR